MVPVRVLPVWAPRRRFQEQSGENDCEGGVIRTGRGEGGIPRGAVQEQGRVGKGQVENCRAVISCEQEPSVDPGRVEERKQMS